MGVGLLRTPREPKRFARWLVEQCDRLGMQDAPFRTTLEHALRRADPTFAKSGTRLQKISRGEIVPQIQTVWQLGDAIRDMQRERSVAPGLLVGGLTALVAMGAYVDLAATLGLALAGHPGDDTVLDLAHRYADPGVVAVEPVAGARGPVTVYPDYEACLMNPGEATRLGIPDDAAVRDAFQDWFGDRRLTRVPRELRQAIVCLNTRDEIAEPLHVISGLEGLASAVNALQWRLSGMEVVTAEQLRNEPTLMGRVVSQHGRLWTQVSLDEDA
jgi:hypothetical protein